MIIIIGIEACEKKQRENYISELIFMVRSVALSGFMHNVSFACKSVITFFYIYDISFKVLPLATTGRIALIIMCLFYGLPAYKKLVLFVNKNTATIFFLLLPVPYSAFLVAINIFEDTTMVSRVAWFSVYSLAGVFLYAQMCNYHLLTAIKILLAVAITQASFVFLSVFQPEFREWVAEAVVQSGNIDFESTIRSVGLSNAGGANLSLQLSIGVASAVLLLRQSRGVLQGLLTILLAAFIVIATVFVGRTGLFLSIVYLIYCFLFLVEKKPLIFLAVLATFSALYAYVVVIGSQNTLMDVDSVAWSRIFSWAFELFLTGDSSSLNELIGSFSETRPLSADDILFGSGYVVDERGLNYSGHDSGYIQTFYAIGLPTAVAFYAALFLMLMRNIKISVHALGWFGYILVSSLFIAEMKEPFIFKYTFPFFILAMAIVAHPDLAHRGQSARVAGVKYQTK